MSNPGVIDLSSGIIANRLFKIEDNIGECIHIHFGEIRLDLTIKEFNEICNKINYALESLINIKNFCINTISPDFLLEIAENLIELKEIKIEKIELQNLYTILEEKDYKQVSIKESSKIRNLICSNIEMNYDIILFNDQNFVRSGIEKVEKLYRDNGNIDVQIKRFYFNNNAFNINYKDFEQQLETINNYKNIIKEVIQMIPNNYKIAIRGAGEHTLKILELIPENKYITCILERKSDRNCDFNGYKVIGMDKIGELNIDVIIISSFKYHQDIKNELNSLYKNDKIKIIDFYSIFEEKGIKAKKPFYLAELGGKTIII